MEGNRTLSTPAGGGREALERAAVMLCAGGRTVILRDLGFLGGALAAESSAGMF